MTQEVPYGFVYETVNKLNGKKYIGKCIYSRQNNWQSYLGSGKYLKRAIAKYGKENFEKSILAEAYSDVELNDLEEYFILKYNAVKSPDYYNIKFTSIGGDIFTTNPRKEDIRQMRKQQMSGKGNHQFGKQKSDKMISSVKEANNRPIFVEGTKFKSQSEAAKILGMLVTTINYRLDSDSFPDWNRLVPKNEVQKNNNNPTCKVEVDGMIFSSIKGAAKALGISDATVIRRLDSKKFPSYKRLSERLR